MPNFRLELNWEKGVLSFPGDAFRNMRTYMIKVNASSGMICKMNTGFVVEYFKENPTKAIMAYGTGRDFEGLTYKSGLCIVKKSLVLDWTPFIHSNHLNKEEFAKNIAEITKSLYDVGLINQLELAHVKFLNLVEKDNLRDDIERYIGKSHPMALSMRLTPYKTRRPLKALYSELNIAM